MCVALALDKLRPPRTGSRPNHFGGVFHNYARSLTAIVLVYFAAACGSPSANTTSPSATPTAPSATPTAFFDKYEGTWVQQALGLQKQDEMSRLLVKKVGDQYAFTDPSGQGGVGLIALQTVPDASGKFRIQLVRLSDNTLATVDGDALKLSQDPNTFAITVDGDKMTWVVTSADEPVAYTLTREATPTTR
jgi:hypothetical protein